MAFDRTQFIARFIQDAKEHLQELNDGLVQMEQTPEDEALIANVFRSAHTLKGTARMMKLIPISDLAHKLEDILDGLRSKTLHHTPSLSDAIFKGVDCLSEMVVQVADGEELEAPNKKLMELLEAAAAGAFEGQTEEIKDIEGVENTEEAKNVEKVQDNEITGKTKKIEAVQETEAAQKIKKAPWTPFDRSSQSEKKPPAQSSHEDQERSPIAEAEAKDAPQVSASKDGQGKASETIRIQSDKLDGLIKCIGELVSSFNRFQSRSKTIGNIARHFDSHQERMPLHDEIKQLADDFREDIRLTQPIVSDLQQRAIEMRMLPLSTIFDGLQRSVRDMAISSGKKVSLSIQGGQTEMDKKIIESLSDPLLHMIRNSIDHGIETPEERVQSGKPETGRISLFAGYEGGKVLITVADDGRGIPMAKITEKALAKGVITDVALNELSETEKLQLIFQPGLSSADIITDLSGRGVGMDVVRRNIEDELKGSIQIQTEEGKGSTFLLRMPLSIALLKVFLIRIGSLKFAIPATYVSEVVRVPTDQWIDVTDKKAIRLRENIIPIIRLGDLLDISTNSEESDSLIMITAMDDLPLGMTISEVMGETDMVIKPLPGHMRYVKLVSGVIVSDNSDIIPVLHVPHIVSSARLMRSGVVKEEGSVSAAQHSANKILVVDDSAATREIEKSILEAYGYAVAVAADGVEGFEQCQACQFDLVISDVDMPNMDGFTLTARLRELADYSDTPIILVTARDSEEDKRRGIIAGASAYIVKGDFDQGNLLETIENLMP